MTNPPAYVFVDQAFPLWPDVHYHLTADDGMDQVYTDHTDAHRDLEAYSEYLGSAALTPCCLECLSHTR
jgi:hypothetical protein